MSESLEWLGVEYHVFFSFFFFMLGAVFASFLNVVIYRVPNDMSIAWPGSHCPKCNHHISWYDNVPIFSWLLLRGKCRHCHEPISIRYPLVELIGAILVWSLFQHFGITPYLLVTAVLSLSLVAISFIDLDHFYIPDVITLPGIVVGLLFSWWTDIPSLKEAILGAVAGAGILALVLVLFKKITGREGMGWGDVKLMGMLGAFLGISAIPAILLIGSAVGILAAVIIMHTGSKEDEAAAQPEKGADKKAAEESAAKIPEKAAENPAGQAVEDDDDFEIPPGAVPYGPFLSIGAMVWVFADQWIIELLYKFQELF